MKLTFLGTGTSNGVPVIGCQCATCTSRDPRDHRLRSSVLLETDSTQVLVDCGPDARQQLMGQRFRKLDGVLLTHAHYDHVGGLDDLRPYCKFGDIDLYANARAAANIRHNFPYCFVEHLYPGVPKFNLHTIEPHREFSIGDIRILPVEVMHDQLQILGFRFGPLAYITDMKTIAPEELPYLKGVKILIVNALRFEKPHHSHLIVSEAIDFARQIGAQQTFFTHATHKIGLIDEANSRLPEGFQFAYDGQSIEF
jgi:phosphoribosyl 1,2-cyclic phosphate phosphodiesterase